MLMITPFLFLASCKKSDNQNNSAGKPYRIIQENIISSDGDNYDTYYKYDGDRISMINASINGTETRKELINYEGDNTISRIISYFDDGNWIYNGKMIYSMENAELKEIISYSYEKSDWYLHDREQFSYLEGNLSEDLVSHYEDGNWLFSYKTLYEYNGDKPMRAIGYEYTGIWEKGWKSEISYDGSSIDYIVDYRCFNEIFEPIGKLDLKYENGRIIEIIYFHYDGIIWSEYGKLEYGYDPNGNLISINDIYDSGTTRIEFLYEEGVGNILKLNGSELYDYSFGNLLPLPTEARSVWKDEVFQPQTEIDLH